MPYPNFHSCRIKNPDLFQEGSIRTLHTKQPGLTILSGKLKSTGKSEVQAFRYDKKVWTPSRAGNHCTSHSGHFEPAIKKSIEADTVIKLKKDSLDFDIRKTIVKDLVEDHKYLHFVWRTMRYKELNEFDGWTKEVVLDYHAKVVDVLRNEGVPMITKSDLDKLSSEKETTIKDLTSSDIPELLKPGGIPIFQGPKKGGDILYKICIEEQKAKGKSETEAKTICESFKKDIKVDLVDQNLIFSSFKEFGSFVQTPDFVSLVGSIDDKINVIIRAENVNYELEKKILTQFPENLRDLICFTYQPDGPTTSHVPLFDLVLKQKKLKFIKINDKKSE